MLRECKKALDELHKPSLYLDVSVSVSEIGSHFEGSGKIGEALKQISKFFNSKVKFSFNGTTQSVRITSLAVKLSGIGKLVLIPPFHMSVVNSACVLGFKLSPVCPEERDYILEYDTLIPPRLEVVKQYLRAVEGACAVWVTSPVYGGVKVKQAYLNEVRGELERDGLLLLDNAWGFGRLEYGGFDIAVRSSHKLDGAPQPASVIIIEKNSRVSRFVDLAYLMTETTSPPFHIAFETARVYGVYLKTRLEECVRGLAEAVINKLKEIGLSVLTNEELERKLGGDSQYYDLDPVQVMVNVGKKNGFSVKQLLEKRGIFLERAGPRSVELLVTINLLDEYAKSEDVLSTLAEEISTAIDSADDREVDPRPVYNFKIVEIPTKIAFVPLDDAEGEIAAAPLVPYPPGIPVVVPGARLTKEVISYIRDILQLGGHVEGFVESNLVAVAAKTSEAPV
jgi:arginine/lysine/ornithine decarboxylase